MSEKLKTFRFFFEKSINKRGENSITVVIPEAQCLKEELAFFAAFNAKLEEKINFGPDYFVEIKENGNMVNIEPLDNTFLQLYEKFYQRKESELSLSVKEEDSCLNYDNIDFDPGDDFETRDEDFLKLFPRY